MDIKATVSDAVNKVEEAVGIKQPETPSVETPSVEQPAQNTNKVYKSHAEYDPA